MLKPALIFIITAFLYAAKSYAYWPAEFLGWEGDRVRASQGYPDGASTLPNPCLGQKFCHINVAVRGTNKYGSDFTYAFNRLLFANNFHPGMLTLRTVGEVEIYLRERAVLPREDTVGISWTSLMEPTNVRTCVVYNTSSGPNIYRTWPGSETCSGVTPPDVRCSMTPDAILLDHGKVGTENADGNTVSTYVQVKCTRNLSVNVKAVSGGRVFLGSNALISILSIGGTIGGGDSFIATPGGYPLEIKSVLRKNGSIAGGEYRGNDTIILGID